MADQSTNSAVGHRQKLVIEPSIYGRFFLTLFTGLLNSWALYASSLTARKCSLDADLKATTGLTLRLKSTRCSRSGGISFGSEMRFEKNSASVQCGFTVANGISALNGRIITTIIKKNKKTKRLF